MTVNNRPTNGLHPCFERSRRAKASPVGGLANMVFAMYALLLLMCILNRVNGVTWTGSANTQSTALAINISPIGTYVTAGMDTSVTTTSSTDRVLLLVNINMKLGATSDYGTFTIFRGTTDLSAASKDFHCIRVADSAELQSTSMTFLDIPGAVGTFTYSVRVSGGGTLSFNGQKRQLAAMVLSNSDFPNNRALVQAKQTFTTTTYAAATGLEAAVTTTQATDYILVCVLLNMQPANTGGGSGAKFTLYRNGVQIGTNPLQVVHSEGQGNNRVATFTFVDNPGSVSTYTYSVWAAKVDATDNAFDINDGSRETAQISTVVVKDSMINSNMVSTALTISSTTWVTCGLSIPSTILLPTDLVLVTVNINFSPATAASIGAFTIFRGTTNLGDANYGLQTLKASNAGESMVASMSFLDSPSATGIINYSVQVRAVSGSFVVSENGQTRQIAVMATQDRTWAPTSTPISKPTASPNHAPSMRPTATPSTFSPTKTPSRTPTVKPSVGPSRVPTISPSAAPSFAPSVKPTVSPTKMPTVAPTAVPSAASSTKPSAAPSCAPTAAPSRAPTTVPSTAPTIEVNDCTSSVCSFPDVVNIATGTLVARVTLPEFFTLTFSLSWPLAVTGAPMVFDLRDSATGKSLLAMTRSGTSSSQWFWNDFPVVNGWPLVSGSIGGSATLTTFTVSILGNTLRIHSNYQNIQLDYQNIDLYASPPALPSSGGTFSAVSITSSTAVPTSAPVTKPTAKPTSTPIFSPTLKPTMSPSAKSSVGPTAAPSALPRDCTLGCALGDVTVTQGRLFKNVILPAYYSLVFDYSVPALASPGTRPNIFDVVDFVTGQSVVAAALTETLATSVSYNGVVLDDSSSALYANRTLYTPYKYHLYSYMIRFRAGEAGTVVKQYDLSNSVSVPKTYSLYFSKPGALSAGGYARNVRIVDDTLKPTLAPTRAPTSAPTTIPTALPLDCVNYCTLPAIAISAGNYVRNVVLSPTFLMEFSLTVPALSTSNSVMPSVFSLLDATAGTNYLTLTLTDTNNVRVVYQNKVLSSNSVSLVTPLTASTDFKINVRANKLYIRSSSDLSTVLSYDVNNTAITDNRMYALYTSAPGTVTAGGSITGLFFQVSTLAPSKAPIAPPSVKPSAAPSVATSASPSACPSAAPTKMPSASPNLGPSVAPSAAPTVAPSASPSASPSLDPTMSPSATPTKKPSASPTIKPSAAPSAAPSLLATSKPTAEPTRTPSIKPTSEPSTARPSELPTAHPSVMPTVEPTVTPTADPTFKPTRATWDCTVGCVIPGNFSVYQGHVLQKILLGPYFKIEFEMIVPALAPSSTVKPNMFSLIEVETGLSLLAMALTEKNETQLSFNGAILSKKSLRFVPNLSVPTLFGVHVFSDFVRGKSSANDNWVPAYPIYNDRVTDREYKLYFSNPADVSAGGYVTKVKIIADVPTTSPTIAPSRVPTRQPTAAPSTSVPSADPTVQPSADPTMDPSATPSTDPSVTPSVDPSVSPTIVPTVTPSVDPSGAPTADPSAAPSAVPSVIPTADPTVYPTADPSADPSVAPSADPSADPTATPTASPSGDPSASPSVDPSVSPSVTPSVDPSVNPSVAPTATPTAVPSEHPTVTPSSKPSTTPSVDPSVVPTAALSVEPTLTPSVGPTVLPTADPSVSPSEPPTVPPTVNPSVATSATPSTAPSVAPNHNPSVAPTTRPSTSPTAKPSVSLSEAPSAKPTLKPTAGPTVQATDAAGIKIPDVPQLSSAVFNNAGSSVIVSFSSATNRAGSVNQFTCSAILSFTDVSTASCVWTDASTITVYPSAANLNVGSPVALITNNKVKAVCPASVAVAVCVSWTQAPAASVSIQAPASPTAPVVVFTASGTLNGCSPWSIDLSSSSGSGGRAWLAPVFTVTSAQGDGSAVAAFLNSGFSFTSPTSVPNPLFPADGVYTISVTLSNFLGASSTNSFAVTVTKSGDAYPTVSIPGQDSRTVLTNAVLLLTPTALTVDCTGVKTTSNLAYTWTVSVKGMVQTSLTSESLDTSRFRLSAYRLTPLKTYDILVTVTNTISGRSSTASVSVIVQQGAVVAQVSSGSSQSILVDGSLTLDASSSHDQDVASLTGSAAGLSFSWSCVQTAPEQSNTCPLTFSGTNQQMLVLTAPSSAADTKSSITVTVTKGSRTSSTTVVVTAQDSSAPLVVITTSTQSVTSVNANNRLSLSASVTAQSSCTAVWSVADSFVQLSTSALTPVSSVIPVGSTRVINLVLAAAALPERSSLVFTLACGQSSAAITVTTNGPPLPGLFSVTPATGGIEMSTSYSFSATFWSDADLPLTYQFGFVSPSNGATLTVQGRSESSFSSTTLAAGRSSALYAVTVSAKVFDALNAASSVTSAVEVKPQSDVTLLRASLTAQLTSSAGNTEETKNAISVGSTVINAVSCSNAPDCAALNRAGCAKVLNTCGACLSGFIGDSGDGNSQCVSAISSGNTDKTVGSTCTSSSDCGGWLACDTTLAAPVCYLPSKRCTDDCSGHGTCAALNANSRKEVTTCSAGDSTCVVSCVCDESFSGINCATNSAELLEKQTLRSQFLQSLSTVASTEDIDSTSVASLSNSLSSLAQNPYELSAEFVGLVNQVANSVLTSAASLGDFSYESALGVLSAIDAAAAATVRMNSSNTVAFANEMMQTISLFNSLVQSQLVAGQDGVEYIQDSFRLSSIRQLRGFNSSIKILSPTSLLEQRNGGGTSSVTIDADSTSSSGSRLLSVDVGDEEEEFAVDMVVTAAASYGSAGASFNSNPVQVTVSRTASTPTRVTFVLVHNGAGNFTSREEAASMTFNSTCTGLEDRSVHFYECPGSNELLSHDCAGLNGVLTSYCPVRAPTCAVLDPVTGVASVNSSVCEVLSFDLYSTTCSCLIQPAMTVRGRRLGDFLDQSGLMDAVSITAYMGSEFKNTFNSADDLTSVAALQRVLIVIIMFSTLWAGGFALIFGLTWRRSVMKKVNEKSESHLEKKVQVAQISRSPAVVHQYLTDYVSQTFPSMFSNKPFFSRLYGEVKRHHRYLKLFTAPAGESGDKQRILTGVELLTIQTMLMFLLAMLYDAQSPSDDGTCPTYTIQDDCLSRKSVFDVSITYCDWTEAGDCMYREPKISFTVLLYVSVIVAILVAIISYPTDLIFDLLTAPVADEIKAAAQDTTVKQIGRRASNVACRASNVAMTAVAAAKVKMARNSYIQGTVTRKLPPTTEAAHALATASMTVIAENSRRTIMNRQMTRMRSYRESGGKYRPELLSAEDLSSSSSDSDSDEESGHSGADEQKRDAEATDGSRYRQEKTNSQTSTNASEKSAEVRDAEAQLMKLSEEVHCQRRLLKPSELDEYDSQWGLDPTGEFTQGERSVVPCLRGRPGAEETLLNELKLVKKQSHLKSEKLNIATDAHTGLEILHLFIIDLLGRDTPAAIIFETKSEEDFQHTKVVTRNTKRLAALALFCINAFFVYYSILTGFRKGVAWQQIFLLACIVQFVVEIFLFETMEVVWINCAIPVLVSDEVRRVGESITEIVANLCSDAPVESRFFLNAPDYLFVSTNVAKQFPHLMESILVQAYQNHIPGELARKWQTGSIARMHRRNRRRQFTIFGLFLRILQYMGTAPFLAHKVFIRFLQPFVFSGLLLLWRLIVEDVIYIAVAVFCLCVVLAYGLYRRYQERHLLQKATLITPITTGFKDTSSAEDRKLSFDYEEPLHLPRGLSIEQFKTNSLAGASSQQESSFQASSHHASSQQSSSGRSASSHRSTPSVADQETPRQCTVTATAEVDFAAQEPPLPSAVSELSSQSDSGMSSIGNLPERSICRLSRSVNRRRLSSADSALSSVDLPFSDSSVWSEEGTDV